MSFTDQELIEPIKEVVAERLEHQAFQTIPCFRGLTGTVLRVSTTH